MNGQKDYKEPLKRAASIDGIVSGGRQLGVGASQSYSPRQAPPALSMDSLTRRTDGFHPMRQSPGGLGDSVEAAEREALLDEPIILDETFSAKPKKRYLVHRHPKLRHSLKRTGLGLSAIVLLAGLYFGYKFYITERHLFRGGGKAPALAANVDINQLKGEGDGRINVLLLGVGGPGHEGADLTDTIMLASIDPINHNVGLLSVPRDLWVHIPGDGYQKINAAYSYGKEQSSARTETGKDKAGLALLDKTLEPVLGVPIHYHAVVDFKAFEQSVNSIGGVNANVPKELSAYEDFWVEGTSRHYLLNVSPGEQHFDGTKALYFARERHNDSDFVRAQRQRLLLAALKDKVMSLGTFSNPVKVSSLMDSLGNNVYTDFNLGEINRLYAIIQQIPSPQISSLDLVTPPHDLLTTGAMNGLSVVEPKAGLFNYSAINNYVRNALRDSFIAKENAKIAVYNATDISGMATAKGDELKSFGYNVTVVDNAPNTLSPAATTIVDYTKGADKYTRHYLEGRFGVGAVTNLPAKYGISPPPGTNFVIILGKDASN